MASKSTRTVVLMIAAFLLATGAFAQTKRKRATTKKIVAPVAPTPTPQPEAARTLERVPAKRNERPNSPPASILPVVAVKQAEGSRYRYEFSQPDFIISKIVIEHDDSGKGTIRFKRRESEDEISDPIEVSQAAMERIKGAYSALSFLASREEYQYERDYSHLGNSVFTLRSSGKERTAGFNYTQNKDAKTLADEYRKIGQQFIWVFDITVARENQPLEAPKLLDSLDALMRRNEISDPVQMKDLLAGLADDERIPLIARNHAARLIKRIEKAKK